MTAAVAQWLAAMISTEARRAGVPGEPIVATALTKDGGVTVDISFVVPAELVAKMAGRLGEGRD